MLWSNWHRLEGNGEARIDFASDNRKSMFIKLLLKYQSKSQKALKLVNYIDADIELVKTIGEVIKHMYLSPNDWNFGQVLAYMVQLGKDLGVKFDLT